MILSGILHTSLGGFTVIRGVAPLGELARCSRFDPTYQRNLIETHKEEIERFLSDKQYLFFPEVVLSASLRFNRSGNDWRDKGFRANPDGLALKIVKTKLPAGYNVVGGQSAPVLAYFAVNDEQLQNERGFRLFRIDGNHRLSAATTLRPGEANYSLPTPFCIVIHDEPAEAQRFEKVVFHNINAKQIPLTSEENLKLILQAGAEALFSDEDLLTKPSFGTAYYLARKLLPEFDARFLAGLAKHFENRHTLALALTQFLIAKDDDLKQAVSVEQPDAQVARLRRALKAVNTVYEAPCGSRLRESGCHGVLVAFTYFALRNNGRQLAAFSHWIKSNRIDRLAPAATTTRGLGYHYHLGRTQAVDAASLVEVFESILTSRHRVIFISMAFRDETKETYETIKKTVQQINEKHQLDIRFREIRIDQFNKGHSYTIDDEILKVIEGSGLLIADLTFGNRNVYHEIGYLMGLNRGKGQEQDNFILIADKKTRGDELEGDICFNLKSWQQFRFESTRQLEDMLTASIETYYSLLSK